MHLFLFSIGANRVSQLGANCVSQLGANCVSQLGTNCVSQLEQNLHKSWTLFHRFRVQRHVRVRAETLLELALDVGGAEMDRL